MYRILTYITLACCLSLPALAENRDWERKPLLKGEGMGSETMAFESRPGKTPISGTLAIDYYLSEGDLNWEGESLFSLLSTARVLRQVAYDSLDADMPILSGSLTLFEHITISALWGEGDISGGTTTAGDFILTPIGNVLERSQSSTSGDIDMLDIAIQLNFFSFFDSGDTPADTELGFYIGQQEMDISLDNSGGRIIQQTADTVSIPFPNQGVNSSINSSWRGFRAGLTGRSLLDPGLPFKFLVQGRLGFLADVELDATASSPNEPLIQEKLKVKNGSGIELDVRTGIAMNEHFEIFVGFRHLTMEAEDGATFFTTPTAAGSATVPKVKTDRTGYYAGAGIRF